MSSAAEDFKTGMGSTSGQAATGEFFFDSILGVAQESAATWERVRERRRQARNLEQQANDIKRQAAYQTEAMAFQGEQAIAQEITSYSAGNVDIGSGSPLAAIAQEENMLARNISIINNEAANQGYSMKQEASRLRHAADIDKQGIFGRQALGVLTGAIRTAGKIASMGTGG